jgi:oxygen-independent coproporphyrinogen-3 oxidase
MNARDSALLRKYNVPGPRYTSYPTVPCWERTPDEAQWIAALGQRLDTPPGAAIYVHIPFCRSLCTYCGCNTRITRNRAIAMPYLEAVLAEWRLYRERLGRETLPVAEIHLGGGTPTFLTPEELQLLIEGLRGSSSGDAEFSIKPIRVTIESRHPGRARLPAPEPRHPGFRSTGAGHRQSRAERATGA